MLFLNIILFTFFMNLCSSFTLMPSKYPSFFFSRSHICNLNMGCDYYIDKDLRIYYYTDTVFTNINLQHLPGYFWFDHSLDEDEDGHDEELNLYIMQTLEPFMKPIVIYRNNTFSNPSFETKYKNQIEDTLNTLDKDWNDVKQIVKIEERYERY